MKHSPIWIAAALLLAACSPQTYSLYLDVRQPSSSGVDLSRKTIAIAYMDGVNGVDSLFDRSAASAMARNLEADYFGGEERVGLYRVPTTDSVSVELMRSLVMETGGDVVFLLRSQLGEVNLESNQRVSQSSSADSSYLCTAAVPVKTDLFVYDSMGSDAVRRFKGSTVVRPQAYNDGTATEEGLKALSLGQVSPEAENVGQRVSSHFLSTWKRESFTLYYFDDNDAWVQALDHAVVGEFSKAIDIWGKLLKNAKSAPKQACACYNMAMAFYLLEDMNLAKDWLDQCDKLENVTLSQSLRKRIDSHLEK